jgi:hypothetical protein
MARSKDPSIQENVDRGAEDEKGLAGNDKENKTEKPLTRESDTIKNASAAGLGTIGGNDQKPTGY